MQNKKPKIIGRIITRSWRGNDYHYITKVETDLKGNTFYTTTTQYDDGFLILAKSAETSELLPAY